MTLVELALILKIIDSHTIVKSYNYQDATTKCIDNVDTLRKDIIAHYNEVMKSD